MDKKKGLVNLSVSLFFKVATMIMTILVKRILIQTCGNEVNGLNALYQSILGFLSVMDLGVGSAIVFCMYKPIVEKDYEQVSALYRFFKNSYLLIGGIIFACGLVITPFIHVFAKDYSQIDVNLYVTFMLMLFSVVITYLFSAKTALFNAYKNNYIATAISSGGIVLQYVLQIVVLLIYQSFIGYLFCKIIALIVQWSITEVIVRWKYSIILQTKQRIKIETKRLLIKNIKAMFMHKVGTLLVNTADSLIISTFIGVVTLGKYSNYVTILNSIIGILQMVFTSFTSIVGHLYVKEDRVITMKYCNAFHMLNFILGNTFILGYYAIIDNLVSLLFGIEVVGERMLTFVIALNGFVVFLRRSVLMFRDATGNFYYDQWKPLVEGIVNIVLSIVLLKKIGVVGVLVATVITNIMICHIVEPYVLYKYAFGAAPIAYYRRNYGMILIFGIEMILLECCMINIDNPLWEVLLNGGISILISIAVCICYMFIMRKQIRNFKEMFLGPKETYKL